MSEIDKGTASIVTEFAPNGINSQSSSAKKKSKKKNKSKVTSKADVDHSNTGSHAECQLDDGTDEHQIQLVSEELLKRLQINGGAETKDTATVCCEQSQCTTNGKSSLVQKSVQGSNSANKPANHHLYNNNNNCKQESSVDVQKRETDAPLCNGVSHQKENDTSSVSHPVSDGCKSENPNIEGEIPSEKRIQSDSTSEADRGAEPSPVGAHSEKCNPQLNQQLPIDSPKISETASGATGVRPVISYKEYENELQMPDIMRVIQRELSEPYSIYTYRYFIHNWPKLCFLAMDGDYCVGAIVCKLDIHRQVVKRGYIAMLAVDQDYRKLKVGTTLVQKAIEAMLVYNADEVVLETEITNIPALRLYENLGFVRDKRLFDYYLNGVDALRLKLWFK